MSAPRKPRVSAAPAIPLLTLDENRFAIAAIKSAIKNGTDGRPLLLSGPSGTGKTLLCQMLIERSSVSTVTTMAALDFAELAERAVDDSAAAAELSSLGAAPLFILEDLHLMGRSRIGLGALATLLDELKRAGSTVVITSLQAPAELSGFLPRVINRLRGGICVSVRLPGIASREKLLLHFAEHLRLSLSKPVLMTFVKNLKVSPRELLASVRRFQEVSRVQRATPDLDLARSFLRDESLPSRITIEDIAQVVSRQFGVSLSEVRSSCRSHAVALPRHCAMYLARELAGLHFAEIGSYFSGRSHNTVMHACQRIRERLPDDARLRQHLQSARQSLRVQ